MVVGLLDVDCDLVGILFYFGYMMFFGVKLIVLCSFCFFSFI